jgi:hypothetical protein
MYSGISSPRRIGRVDRGPQPYDAAAPRFGQRTTTIHIARSSTASTSEKPDYSSLSLAPQQVANSIGVRDDVGQLRDRGERSVG